MTPKQVRERGIEVRAGGIPALVVVDYYDLGRPMRPPTMTDPGDPEEYAEMDFRLYDRKGYPAGDWLYQKADMDEIERQLWRMIERGEVA